MTVFDSSQTPRGMHTVYGWHVMPFRPNDNPPESADDFKAELADRVIEKWRASAPNMTDENILARWIYTPGLHMAGSPTHPGEPSQAEVAISRPELLRATSASGPGGRRSMGTPRWSTWRLERYIVGPVVHVATVFNGKQDVIGGGATRVGRVTGKERGS